MEMSGIAQNLVIKELPGLPKKMHSLSLSEMRKLIDKVYKQQNKNSVGILLGGIKRQ